MTPTILCRVLWPTYLPQGITKEVSLANSWYTELTNFHNISHNRFFQLVHSAVIVVVVVVVWGLFLQFYSWQGSSSLAKVHVLQVKDLGLALAAAEESGAATPLGMKVLQMWVDLVWHCHLHWSCVGLLLNSNTSNFSYWKNAKPGLFTDCNH